MTARPRRGGSTAPAPDSQYQRDRARIIHGASFRSLQSKTQVLGLGESDFYRTRLTHSLEVAQIGSGICEWLRERSTLAPAERALVPSFSLIEAICLAHDIGHAPFGHGGEVAMNAMMREHGGFEANGQTLRIVARLGEYSAELRPRPDPPHHARHGQVSGALLRRLPLPAAPRRRERWTAAGRALRRRRPGTAQHRSLGPAQVPLRQRGGRARLAARAVRRGGPAALRRAGGEAGERGGPPAQSPQALRREHHGARRRHRLRGARSGGHAGAGAGRSRRLGRRGLRRPAPPPGQPGQRDARRLRSRPVRRLGESAQACRQPPRGVPDPQHRRPPPRVCSPIP